MLGAGFARIELVGVVEKQPAERFRAGGTFPALRRIVPQAGQETAEARFVRRR